MEKICVYIDGFNLYHSIDDTGQQHLKWLDLSSLSKLLVHNISGVSIEKIYYFTAYAQWKDNNSLKRHKDYVAALKARGVTVIFGKFKNKHKRCKSCGCEWVAHEEKETDVNIALRLYDDAVNNIFDTGLVITADTDLAPALRLVKEKTTKNIVAVFPPGRQFVNALIMSARQNIRISLDMLRRCQLPDSIVLESGRVVVRPDKYREKITKS